jgi:hypothetical protein
MTYRVLRGIDYRPAGSKDTVRAEPGDVVDDLRPATADRWLARGIVEKADL